MPPRFQGSLCNLGEQHSAVWHACQTPCKANPGSCAGAASVQSTGRPALRRADSARRGERECGQTLPAGASSTCSRCASPAAGAPEPEVCSPPQQEQQWPAWASPAWALRTHSSCACATSVVPEYQLLRVAGPGGGGGGVPLGGALVSRQQVLCFLLSQAVALHICSYQAAWLRNLIHRLPRSRRGCRKWQSAAQGTGVKLQA